MRSLANNYTICLQDSGGKVLILGIGPAYLRFVCVLVILTP